jgi:Flp pilus assembly protein TadD
MGRRADPGFDRHLIEGRAHFRRGSFASATQELAMAQSRDPSRPEVHRLLGLCYARQGRSEEACGALREALRLNPLDFVARGALAICLSQNGEPATAIEELERGKIILRERAGAISQEARARVESGRLADAFAMLRRAAWLRLGTALLQYYLDGVVSDHCLLELAFRDWDSHEPMSGSDSC